MLSDNQMTEFIRQADEDLIAQYNRVYFRRKNKKYHKNSLVVAFTLANATLTFTMGHYIRDESPDNWVGRYFRLYLRRYGDMSRKTYTNAMSRRMRISNGTFKF